MRKQPLINTSHMKCVTTLWKISNSLSITKIIQANRAIGSRSCSSSSIRRRRIRIRTRRCRIGRISGSRKSNHVFLLEAGIESPGGDPLERFGDSALEDAMEHGVEAEGAKKGANNGGYKDSEIKG